MKNNNLKRKKEEIIDYIKYYTLSSEANDIIQSSNILNESGFDLWSFKKLIFLNYYLKIHLQILENQGYDCFFIDMFSSCGASNIPEYNLNCIGSPIISLLKGVIPNKRIAKNNRFKRWFFIDSKKEYLDALKKRVDKTCKIIKQEFNEELKIGEDIEILEGDSNELIKRVISKILSMSKKPAILAFIDPYKFSNIRWETFQEILKPRVVDIIFTLPTLTMNRGIDLCKQKKLYLPPTLLEKCCLNKISQISTKEISQSYAKDIVYLVRRSINYYEKGISVKNNFNGEIYQIHLFTHSKKACSICEDFGKKLENLSCKEIKNLFHIAEGKQKTLLDF